MANNSKINVPALIINVAITLSVGFIGSFFTRSSTDTWYRGINKPSFNPPDSVFGPVWTLLYILIGIAAYRVWQKRDTITHFPRTFAIYAIQLILNLLWSYIFFYLRDPAMALVEIFILLAMIVVNAIVFYKVDKASGLLFIPYLLWVSFATVLNYSIVQLN
ncbi:MULTISPECIES: TspO/MBR family protein [Pedobacter]|uniref:TspO/MBR family protein n=1 Tax=Pedobacter TaxID=84567 RepID=UPI00210ED6D2|nr:MULTISPECIES: TspO/MBR family protein [unclassified Pedobacter]